MTDVDNLEALIKSQETVESDGQFFHVLILNNGYRVVSQSSTNGDDAKADAFGKLRMLLKYGTLNLS